MIRNIIFDLGKVLVDWDPDAALLRMGLSEEEARLIADKTARSPAWNDIDRGLDKETLFKGMLENLPQESRPAADRFLHETVFDGIHPYSYSAGWLKGLKARGYRLYVLTNYSDWMFDHHYAEDGTFTFKESLDGMIVSGREKLLKPEAAIYNCLLKRYGLKAEESVFLDDRLENVEGAIKCGLHGIQFNNFQQGFSDLETLLS